MFIITNRALDEDATGLDRLGRTPNPRGPNELRLVEAERTAQGWEIDILPDVATEEMKEEAKIVSEEPVHASRYVARKILERVNPKRAGSRRKGRNLLFFVHGYNNDIEAVLNRAKALQDNYNVEVLPFSWPADGGGFHGTASYLSDKRDAKASVGAVDRALVKMYEYLNLFIAEYLWEVAVEAGKKFPDNPEHRDRYITEKTEKGCPFTLSIMLHSMGAYLYKQVLKSTASEGNQLLFDNVILTAADVNNHGHAEWVDRIKCRRYVYVTINEDDSALAASRLKLGEQQWARLGHYPFNLHSDRAIYVNFTDAGYVGREHSYFENRPLKNPAVKRFFDRALNGGRAHEGLRYDTATNMHGFRR